MLLSIGTQAVQALVLTAAQLRNNVVLTAGLKPAQHQRKIPVRSEEHTSELQSRPHNSYAVFCLKKKNLFLPAQFQIE